MWVLRPYLEASLDYISIFIYLSVSICSVVLKGIFMAYPRTPQDMDGTLTLIFANSKTTWDFVTKFSALLQLRKIWILTKFEGCSSKIGPTTPFWSFLHFWREIQILSTYDLNFLHKAGFHRGWQLVKIWCWYLQPLLRNSKLTNFIFFSVT